MFSCVLCSNVFWGHYVPCIYNSGKVMKKGVKQSREGKHMAWRNTQSSWIFEKRFPSYLLSRLCGANESTGLLSSGGVCLRWRANGCFISTFKKVLQFWMKDTPNITHLRNKKMHIIKAVSSIERARAPGGFRKTANLGQYAFKVVNIGGICQSHLYVPNFLLLWIELNIGM